MQSKPEKTSVSKSGPKKKSFAAILIVCVFVFLAVVASVSIVVMSILSDSKPKPDVRRSQTSNQPTESIPEADARLTMGEKGIRYSVVKMDRKIDVEEDKISVDLFATNVEKKLTREELTSIWVSDLKIRVSKKFTLEKPTVAQIRLAYSIHEQPGFSWFEVRWKDGHWEELTFQDFE